MMKRLAAVALIAIAGLCVASLFAVAAPDPQIRMSVATCDPNAPQKCAFTCDLSAKYDASDTGSITMVTGVAGKKIYICGFILANGGVATNLKLVEGTNANCAAGAADVTPAFQISANQSTGALSSVWTGLATATAGNFLCVNASGANAHQAIVWFAQQ